ncbi:hypothetical protein BHE74_00026898 [Ensete ventricosum]|nr:hypothetical protein GW17_00014066 [Ensete ventricosum]RWW65776.1 hypothetical protein BHE74_00026898 [Ensete ventricosum]
MRRDLPSQHRGSRCHLHAPVVPLYVIINNHRHAAVAPARGRPCKWQPWPRGCPLQPRRGAAPCNLAAGLPLATSPRAAAPCGLAMGYRVLRALPMPVGTAIHARGWPRLLAIAPCELAAPARGFGRGRPPLHVAWPWLAAPTGGLAVVSHPFSSLLSL